MNWLLILRVKQLVFSFVLIGLSAYVISWYNNDIRTRSPSQVNLLLTAPILSLLSLAYIEGTSRFAKRAYNQYIAIGLDVFNSILYFSGFISMAVFLSGLFFCRGNVCSAARADTVFAAFSWVGWTASAVLGLLTIVRSRTRKASPRNQAPFPPEMKEGSRA